MKKLVNSFVSRYYSITKKITVILLPHLSQGVQKVVLANHYCPEVRRKALIALGGIISDSCHLNQGIRIVIDYPATSSIQIGKRVSVAPNVQFICNSGPHDQSQLLNINYVKNNLVKANKIIIADDVWIGAGAIILPGVKIGKSSIIGAGSLVVNDVPEFSVVAGAPARIIRNLHL